MSLLKYMFSVFGAIYLFLNSVTGFAVSSKPIDLTWSFGNDTIYWVGVQRFEFTKKIAGFQNNSFWYSANEFCAGEHGGTHLDAPYHFYEQGHKVADIPVENLITEGVVIDISEDTKKYGPTTQLKVQHLINWEREHGPFAKNTVVLVKFGWSKYYGNMQAYLGLSDSNNTLNFPDISAEAAQWLADTNAVVGVGVDTASVDARSKSDVHRILTSNQIYLLENVKLVEPLPVCNFKLLVMPMKIAEGTGAPVRLIALPNLSFFYNI